MSRAKECDCCGALALPADCLGLDVEVPTEKPDTYHGWSDVDICRECWKKPLVDVLLAACRGIETKLGRVGRPRPRKPSPEPHA